EIAAGTAQYPAAELHRQSGELGDGQEFGGGHQAADLVRRAQEVSDRDDRARGEQQARLVVQLELVLLDGLRELLLPVEPRERGPPQRIGVERDRARAVLATAGVEGSQGALDELARARAVGARQRDADLRRQLEYLAVEIDGVLERLGRLVDGDVGVGARAD